MVGFPSASPFASSDDFECLASADGVSVVDRHGRAPAITAAASPAWTADRYFFPDPVTSDDAECRWSEVITGEVFDHCLAVSKLLARQSDRWRALRLPVPGGWRSGASPAQEKSPVLGRGFGVLVAGAGFIQPPTLELRV
jgi:hypothetical protein